MLRYNEAVKADVRKRMEPPQRQCLTAISQELGIYVVTPIQVEVSVAPARRDGLKVSDNLFGCVPGAFWVESPVPPGRMRTLIHPGPVSPGQVTIDVTHFAAPGLMRADGAGVG